MADIINLRQARKARDKLARESQAAENRVRFGRSKAERERLEADDRAAAKHVEGHRLESGNGPDEPA